jgi:N-acetylglucosaminyldiphosphoundecaprenol N-acetyl-beta-D-mannosaminyltransferase
MSTDTATAPALPEGARRMSVLGVPVSLVNLPRAVDLVVGWARSAPARTVFVREVPSLMAAVDTPALNRLHDHADLIVPDGMPLVWVGRAKGHGTEIGRVAGADLMDAVCAASLATGQSHYFFGGKPGVAEKAASTLAERHKGLVIAGTYSPPMRDIGPDFRLSDDGLAEVEAIRASGADFIWVGISSPKQEYWMMQAAPLVGRGVFFGVGAAFDFHSGAVQRAPGWMRNNGLEWLHRLISEPRRLWRRYLILAPRFVWLLLAERLGLTRRSG